MVLAIVGSRQVRSEREIRSVIKAAYQRFGSDLVVVSGGQPRGADGIAKRIATEEAPYKDEIGFREYPPAHYDHTEYCVKEPDHYGKEYDKRNFALRNLEIAEAADKMVAVRHRRGRNRGTDMVCRMFREKGKEPKEITV
jgi:hypothetical protein